MSVCTLRKSSMASHLMPSCPRWVKGEITFQTYQAARLRDASFGRPGSLEEISVRKIRGACAVAKSQGLDYVWIDNCCIDKSSSEELRTALNSMFAWYHEADTCYAFLGDVSFSHPGERMFDRKDDSSSSERRPSVWFERGWTLQELLAPQRLQFYDRSWKLMGTRHDFAEVVEGITHIPSNYLTDKGSRDMQFRSASVATKMSWMAGRSTRDVEDIAYSLLGIMNVNLVPMYGEGFKAFTRLQEALLMDSNAFDESLFAWQIPNGGRLACFRKYEPSQESEIAPSIKSDRVGLIASSPDCFARPSEGAVIVDKSQVVRRLANGFQKTHQGVTLTLPLKETKHRLTGRDRKEIGLTLNCQIGGNNVVIDLVKDADGLWQRINGGILDGRKGAKVGDNKVLKINQGSALLDQVTVAQPPVELVYQ